MKNILIVIQIVVSVLFMLSVLVQSKGSGLSGAISGQAATVQSTKRGAEKLVSQASVVLAIIFVLLSLIFVFVP
jgi:preprotein translocase subunit SecG